MNAALEQLKVDQAYWRSERLRFAEWIIAQLGEYGNETSGQLSIAAFHVRGCVNTDDPPIRPARLAEEKLVERWLSVKDSYEAKP